MLLFGYLLLPAKHYNTIFTGDPALADRQIAVLNTEEMESAHLLSLLKLFPQKTNQFNELLKLTSQAGKTITDAIVCLVSSLEKHEDTLKPLAQAFPGCGLLVLTAKIPENIPEYIFACIPADSSDALLTNTLKNGIRHGQIMRKALMVTEEAIEAKVRERTEEIRHVLKALTRAHQRLEDSYFEAIPVFASLVQMREDGSTEGHSRQVAELARQTALAMKLDDTAVRDIYNAALLHDMGKLAIPDEILNKPEAKMNFTERDIYRRHAINGEAVLMGMEPLQGVARLIRSHHELFNGKGYPDGLRGKEIPLGSRILCIANDYDNLVKGRLLGEKLSVIDAVDFLRDSSRYDQEVVKAFMDVLEDQGHTAGSVRESRLEPNDLQAGMKLSRNLMSQDGMLLMTRGSELTEASIRRLQAFFSREKTSPTIFIYARKGDVKTA